MKKICLLLFFAFCLSIVASSSNAWESNLTIKCINENLDPCSSSDISSNKSNENSDLDLDKAVTKKKKKVVKKKVTKKKKKKVVKKKVTKKKKKKVVKKKVTKKKKKKVSKKKKKKVAKKKKKDISLKTSSNKSNTNFDFDRDISFEEFKTLLTEYSNISDYPNIDN